MKALSLVIFWIGLAQVTGGLFDHYRRHRRKLNDAVELWSPKGVLDMEQPKSTPEETDDFTLQHVFDPDEELSGNPKAGSLLLSQFASLRMVLLARHPEDSIHKIRYYSSSSEKVQSVVQSPRLQKSANVETLFPAFDDPETVANFAKMTSNAYMARVLTGWHNVPDYDTSDGFGWDQSGLRGYIFVNKARNIVIIAYKGTSILLAGDTVSKDKINDNIMFSCCCGRVDISWIPVCGCYSGGYLGRAQTCSASCLKDAVRADPDSYYNQAQRIVDQVRQLYPTARIWFTGHSLGGAIANLMTVSNPGTSAISFSAPGEMLYAQRLGLIPETEDPHAAPFPIWNFGVSTDPIFKGTCNGISSSCYISGYALETGCRMGHDCMWQKEGRDDVGTHRIDWMLDNVILTDPPLSHPVCNPIRNCRDCTSWSFS